MIDTNIPESVMPFVGPCAKDDCTRPVKSRGLCNTHYQYGRNHGEFVVEKKVTRAECLVLVAVAPGGRLATTRRAVTRPTRASRKGIAS